MEILRRNWWKLIITVLVSIIIRVLLLQLIPLRSSSTFELPPSIFSKSIGMMPTAAIIITLSYTIIASVLIIMQENISDSKLKRILICSLPFSFIWFMGVLESVSSLGKPLMP